MIDLKFPFFEDSSTRWRLKRIMIANDLSFDLWVEARKTVRVFVKWKKKHSCRVEVLTPIWKMRGSGETADQDAPNQLTIPINETPWH